MDPINPCSSLLSSDPGICIKSPYIKDEVDTLAENSINSLYTFFSNTKYDGPPSTAELKNWHFFLLTYFKKNKNDQEHLRTLKEVADLVMSQAPNFSTFPDEQNNEELAIFNQLIKKIHSFNPIAITRAKSCPIDIQYPTDTQHRKNYNPLKYSNASPWTYSENQAEIFPVLNLENLDFLDQIIRSSDDLEIMELCKPIKKREAIRAFNEMLTNAELRPKLIFLVEHLPFDVFCKVLLYFNSRQDYLKLFNGYLNTQKEKKILPWRENIFCQHFNQSVEELEKEGHRILSGYQINKNTSSALIYEFVNEAEELRNKVKTRIKILNSFTLLMEGIIPEFKKSKIRYNTLCADLKYFIQDRSLQPATSVDLSDSS
jgi:hypothetical protein